MATATAFRPGPVVTSQIAASRVSGSNDFAGQWQDTSYLQRHGDMTLKLDSQTLHISYPGAGQSIDAPLNGWEASVQGPHDPAGVTYKLVGRREIHALAKRNGRAVAQGSFKLSNDGRVITESWWNPEQPAGKSILVYEKQ